MAYSPQCHVSPFYLDLSHFLSGSFCCSLWLFLILAQASLYYNSYFRMCWLRYYHWHYFAFTNLCSSLFLSHHKTMGNSDLMAMIKYPKCWLWLGNDQCPIANISLFSCLIVFKSVFHFQAQGADPISVWSSLLWLHRLQTQKDLLTGQLNLLGLPLLVQGNSTNTFIVSIENLIYQMFAYNLHNWRFIARKKGKPDLNWVKTN